MVRMLRTSILLASILAIVPSLAVAQKKKVTFESLSGKGERVIFSAPAPASWTDDGKNVRTKDGESVVVIDPATLQKAAGAASSESRPGRESLARSRDCWLARTRVFTRAHGTVLSPAEGVRRST